MLAIYTRLSIENEDSTSISNQIREGKEFAKNKGIAYQIYNEGEGVSGTLDIKDRSELQRLIDDIAEGKISSIWMRNQNRMERNSLTFHLFADIIKKNNVKLFFADGKEVDYNDPNTFLSSSILSTLNAYSAHLQSVQTKKSLKDNAKEGKAHGILPYGYTTDKNGFIIIDNEEAEIVKRIFQLSLTGKGTRSIAELLNKEGVQTRYNKIGKGTISTKNKYTNKITTTDKKNIKWAGNTIRNIISNTIYKGKRKFGGVEYDVPNILESSYWKKVNDNLKNNANNSGKKTEYKYLLKGTLECSKCGRNMYGRTRANKKDNYYMCSSKRYKDENCGNRSINIDVLENIIWIRFFKDDNFREHIIKLLLESTDKKYLDTIKLKIDQNTNKLNKLQEEKNKAVSLVVKGLLKEEDLKPELQRIEREKREVEELLELNAAEIKKIEQTEKIKEEIQIDFRGINNTTPFKKRKEIIEKYIDRIYINYIKEKRVYLIKIKYKLSDKQDFLILDDKYRIYIDSLTEKRTGSFIKEELAEIEKGFRLYLDLLNVQKRLKRNSII